MDTLEKLEEKISKAVALIEKLKDDNNRLAGENSELKQKLIDYESRLSEIEKSTGEKSEKIKDRLGNILDKLEVLEKF